MDYSQYIRLKQEAANVYLARNKPIDSSFLTMQKQQKAAYAGSSRFKTTPYFNGNLTLNPILYDISSCPIDHAFTQGYINSLKLSQQETMASEKAGAVICGGVDYSTAPSGIFLLNPSTCSTIRSSYNNNDLKPAIFEKYIEDIRYIYPTNLASMYFDGTSFIRTSTDTVYSGNSDFTLEFFVRPSAGTGPSSTQTLLFLGKQATEDTYKLVVNLVSNIGNPNSIKSYTLSVKVSTVVTLNVGELYPEKWHHVALMRFGNIMYFYINGQRVNYANIPENIPSDTGTTTYLSGDESALIVGARFDGLFGGSTNAFIGHITNLRWTKGMAVYTEPIDVPPVTTLIEKFKTPTIPLFIYSRSDAFTHLYRYVSVGLLAETASTLLLNTRSPTATVSINETVSGFTTVKWAII